MNSCESKTQKLKKSIEESREKLNELINQDTPDVTEEVLDKSQKLDILIKDYYYNQQK